MLGIVEALAGAQYPAGGDEEGEYEDEEHGARTDGHERLEHELRVEVDAIEGADAATGRVREQLAVQEHRAEYPVEASEHGQREPQVEGHLGAMILGRVGRPRYPYVGEVARYRMHHAYEHLDEYLRHALPVHGDAPVLDAVVDYEQLEEKL